MSDSLPPSGLVREILFALQPAECRLIGSEVLEDICAFRFDADADEAEEGVFYLSALDSVALLANLASILAFAWQVFERSSGKPPPLDAVDVEVLAGLPDGANTPEQTRLALYVLIRTRRSQ